MKYRQVGTASLKVSEIALGCAGFWGDRLFSGEQGDRDRPGGL